MGTRFRWYALVSGLIALLTSHPARADEARLSRVRSEDPAITRLVSAAFERSGTMRREIALINATNGLVYLQEGQCGQAGGALACLVHTVKLAGPLRLLRVNLDLRRNDCTLMGAIGHELWHAVEALSDPGVTTNARIVSFFQRLGPTGRNQFETQEAIDVGDDVAREACRGERSRRR